MPEAASHHAPWDIFVFAGPSLHGTGLGPNAADPAGSRIHWMPPARRGDIERLAASRPVADERRAVIALADGTFHSYPSVRHIELRDAIDAGWLVFGLCSMGAIRVAEMQHLGMRPWGQVAQRFCADPDFADDEVALVHGSSEPYLPLSEPMVHIREFLSAAAGDGLVSQAQHDQVIDSLRCRWYGERTLANLRRELQRSLGTAELPQALSDRLRDFAPYRLKQADLTSFIQAAPWASSPTQAQS